MSSFGRTDLFEWRQPSGAAGHVNTYYCVGTAKNRENP